MNFIVYKNCGKKLRYWVSGYGWLTSRWDSASRMTEEEAKTLAKQLGAHVMELL